MWNNFNNNANRGGNRSRRSNGGYRSRGNRGHGGSPHWDNHYHNAYPHQAPHLQHHQFNQQQQQQQHFGNGNAPQFSAFSDDSFQQSHFFRGGIDFDRPSPPDFRNNVGRGRDREQHFPVHHINRPKRFLSPPHSGMSMQPIQRPPSPLPGSEEYRQRNIQHTSELIKRQLLGGDDSLVEPVLNVNADLGMVEGGVPSVFQRDSVAQQQPPQQQQLPRSHASGDKKKDRTKIRTSRNNESESSSNMPIDVHEIHHQIVRHISNLSYNKKLNIVNQVGNTAGYDVAILQIQKQKRLELSRALRDLCSSNIAIDPDSDVLNDIIPDIGIKLEDLPREVIEELSSLNAEHHWGSNADELDFKHDTPDASQQQFLSDLATASPPLEDVHMGGTSSCYIDSTIVDPELCFKQAEQLISGFDEETSEFIITEHLYDNGIIGEFPEPADELPGTGYTEEPPLFCEQVPEIRETGAVDSFVEQIPELHARGYEQFPSTEIFSDQISDIKHDLSCRNVNCDYTQPVEQISLSELPCRELSSVTEETVKLFENATIPEFEEQVPRIVPPPNDIVEKAVVVTESTDLSIIKLPENPPQNSSDVSESVSLQTCANLLSPNIRTDKVTSKIATPPKNKISIIVEKIPKLPPSVFHEESSGRRPSKNSVRNSDKIFKKICSESSKTQQLYCDLPPVNLSSENTNEVTAPIVSFDEIPLRRTEPVETTKHKKENQSGLSTNEVTDEASSEITKEKINDVSNSDESRALNVVPCSDINTNSENKIEIELLKSPKSKPSLEALCSTNDIEKGSEVNQLPEPNISDVDCEILSPLKEIPSVNADTEIVEKIVSVQLEVRSASTKKTDNLLEVPKLCKPTIKLDKSGTQSENVRLIRDRNIEKALNIFDINTLRKSLINSVKLDILREKDSSKNKPPSKSNQKTEKPLELLNPRKSEKSNSFNVDVHMRNEKLAKVSESTIRCKANKSISFTEVSFVKSKKKDKKFVEVFDLPEPRITSKSRKSKKVDSDLHTPLNSDKSNPVKKQVPTSSYKPLGYERLKLFEGDTESPSQISKTKVSKFLERSFEGTSTASSDRSISPDSRNRNPENPDHIKQLKNNKAALTHTEPLEEGELLDSPIQNVLEHFGTQPDSDIIFGPFGTEIDDTDFGTNSNEARLSPMSRRMDSAPMNPFADMQSQNLYEINSPSDKTYDTVVKFSDLKTLKNILPHGGEIKGGTSQNTFNMLQLNPNRSFLPSVDHRSSYRSLDEHIARSNSNGNNCANCIHCREKKMKEDKRKAKKKEQGVQKIKLRRKKLSDNPINESVTVEVPTLICDTSPKKAWRSPAERKIMPDLGPVAVSKVKLEKKSVYDMEEEPLDYDERIETEEDKDDTTDSDLKVVPLVEIKEEQDPDQQDFSNNILEQIEVFQKSMDKILQKKSSGAVTNTISIGSKDLPSNSDIRKEHENLIKHNNISKNNEVNASNDSTVLLSTDTGQNILETVKNISSISADNNTSKINDIPVEKDISGGRNEDDYLNETVLNSQVVPTTSNESNIMNEPEISVSEKISPRMNKVLILENISLSDLSINPPLDTTKLTYTNNVTPELGIESGKNIEGLSKPSEKKSCDKIESDGLTQTILRECDVTQSDSKLNTGENSISSINKCECSNKNNANDVATDSDIVTDQKINTKALTNEHQHILKTESKSKVEDSSKHDSRATKSSSGSHRHSSSNSTNTSKKSSSSTSKSYNNSKPTSSSSSKQCNSSSKDGKHDKSTRSSDKDKKHNKEHVSRSRSCSSDPSKSSREHSTSLEPDKKKTSSHSTKSSSHKSTKDTKEESQKVDSSKDKSKSKMDDAKSEPKLKSSSSRSSSHTGKSDASARSTRSVVSKTVQTDEMKRSNIHTQTDLRKRDSVSKYVQVGGVKTHNKSVETDPKPAMVSIRIQTDDQENASFSSPHKGKSKKNVLAQMRDIDKEIERLLKLKSELYRRANIYSDDSEEDTKTDMKEATSEIVDNTNISKKNRRRGSKRKCVPIKDEFKNKIRKLRSQDDVHQEELDSNSLENKLRSIVDPVGKVNEDSLKHNMKTRGHKYKSQSDINKELEDSNSIKYILEGSEPEDMYPIREEKAHWPGSSALDVVHKEERHSSKDNLNIMHQELIIPMVKEKVEIFTRARKMRTPIQGEDDNSTKDSLSATDPDIISMDKRTDEEIPKTRKLRTPIYEEVDNFMKNNLNIGNEVIIPMGKRTDEEIARTRKLSTPIQKEGDNSTKDSLNVTDPEVMISMVKRKDELITRTRKLRTPIQKVVDNSRKDCLNISDPEVKIPMENRKDELITRSRKLRTPILKEDDNSIKDSLNVTNPESIIPVAKPKEELMNRTRKVRTPIQEVADNSMKDSLNIPDPAIIIPTVKRKDELITRSRKLRTSIKEIDDSACTGTKDVLESKVHNILEPLRNESEDATRVIAKPKTRKPRTKGSKHNVVCNSNLTNEIVKSDEQRMSDVDSVEGDVRAYAINDSYTVNSISIDDQQMLVDQSIIIEIDDTHENLKSMTCNYSQESRTNKSILDSNSSKSNVNEMQKTAFLKVQSTEDTIDRGRNNKSTGIEMEGHSNEMVGIAKIVLINKEKISVGPIAKETWDTMNKRHTSKTLDDNGNKAFDGSIPSTSMNNVTTQQITIPINKQNDNGKSACLEFNEQVSKEVEADNESHAPYSAGATETDIVLSNVESEDRTEGDPKLTRNKRLVTRRGNRSDHDDIITQTRMARRIAHKNAEAVKIVEQTRKLRAQRKSAQKSNDLQQPIEGTDPNALLTSDVSLGTNLELQHSSNPYTIVHKNLPNDVPGRIQLTDPRKNSGNRQTMEKVLYDEHFEQFARNLNIGKQVGNVASGDVNDVIESQEELPSIVPGTSEMQKTKTGAEMVPLKKGTRKRKILEPVRRRRKITISSTSTAVVQNPDTIGVGPRNRRTKKMVQENTTKRASLEVSTNATEENNAIIPPASHIDEMSLEIQTINANFSDGNLTGHSFKDTERRSASITSLCASDGFENLMEVAYEEPIIHSENLICDHKGPKRKRRRRGTRIQKYISDAMARRASISVTESIDSVARNISSDVVPVESASKTKETQLSPSPTRTIQFKSSFVNIVRYTLDELLIMKAKLLKPPNIDHVITEATETTEAQIDSELLTSHLDIKCEPRSVDSRHSEHDPDDEPPSIEDSRLTALYSQSDCEDSHAAMEMPVLEESTDTDFERKERKADLTEIDVDMLEELTTEIINDFESQMGVYVADSSQSRIDLPRDGPDDEPSTIIDRETFGGCTGPIIAVRAIDSYVLGGSDRGCLYIYDLSTSTLLHTLDIATKALTALCIVRLPGRTPTSDKSEAATQLLYTGALDRTVAVIDYKCGTIKQRIPCNEPVQCMEYKWGYVFIGTYNGSLRRLNTKTNVIEDAVNIANTTTVLQLKAAQEGARRVLLVATRNQAVSVRDAMTGLLLRTMDTTLNPTVYTLLCDRSSVYCGTSKHDVLIYSFQDGQLIHKLEESNGSGVVCLTRYKKLLFTGCYNGNIYAYKLPSNEYVGVIPGPGGLLLSMDILDNKIAVSTRLNFKSIDIPDTILAHGS